MNNDFDFEDLHKVVTPEQLKLLASFAISKTPPEEVDNIALMLLSYLIWREDPDLTDDEITEQINQLYVNNIVTTLENDGLIQSVIDENGEFLFGLTDKGKEVYDTLEED